MKYSELTGKNEQEMKELLRKKQKRLSELIFLRAQGKVKNVQELGALRQDIARIKTYQRGLPV